MLLNLKQFQKQELPITVVNSTKMEAYSTNEEIFYNLYLEREAGDLSWVVLPLDEISSQSFKEEWWINDKYYHPVTEALVDFQSVNKLKTRTFPAHEVQLDDVGLYLIPILTRVYAVRVMDMNRAVRCFKRASAARVLLTLRLVLDVGRLVLKES